MQGDIISILEAAYSEAETERWLEALVDSACPTLDVGFGVIAHTYRVDQAQDVTFVGNTTIGCLPSSAAHMEHARRTFFDWPTYDATRGVITTTKPYPLAPWAGLLSERLAVTRPVLTGDASGASGVDAFGVLASDPSGDGVCVLSSTPRTTRPTAATRRLWTMVAVHIAAGYRIVRSPAKTDAVLRADGRIEHAEDEATSLDARASLRDASKAIDRARSRLRRAKPEEAIALWRGLVQGTWSLVDHVDSDGKRFLFAKRNTPDVRSWHTLSAREQQVLSYAAEGHSHKLIGYELGISESTSARHLTTAARKIGARSRLDLIRAYRAAERAGAS